MRVQIALLSFLTAITSACSPGAFTSNSALGGSLIGAGVGVGAGAIAHEVDNSIVASTAMGAGALAGAGLGILIGASQYDTLYEETQNQTPVRRALIWDRTSARTIDDLRMQVNESTLYGNGETKSWEERYLDENPAEPFQGPSLKPRTLEW